VLDVDLNLVIEADLHLLTVIIIQLGTAPAQYDSVLFLLFLDQALMLLGLALSSERLYIHCVSK